MSDPVIANSVLEMSAEIGEIAKALAAAQAEMTGASKDATNPFFNSKYADLASTWEACRAALTKHGIAVVQAPAANENEVTVATMLLHGSGQWLRSTLTLLAKDASPQSIGSAITYARRYGLAAMVGVAPEDDDGNAAQTAAPSRPAQRYQAPSKPATAEEARRLFPNAEDEERNTLVAEITRLGKILKLTAPERTAFKTEYLGGAEIFDADVSALATMVAELKKREPKA